MTPRSPGSRREPPADEATVRRLLAAQVPWLAGAPLRAGPVGWDNRHWLVGDGFAVRLPRRRLAVMLVAHEARWLPRIAPALPLRVPVPVHVGRPEDPEEVAGGDPWPWPWTVVPWFEGERADVARPSPAPAAHASALGSFLRALHVPAPPDAPYNPYRSVPLVERDARTREAVTTMRRRGLLDEADVVERAWERGLAAGAHVGRRTWIHGDLHPGNQVVHQGRLTAVVDWGDVAGGDPAADLATAWWTLPVAVHAALRREYGSADADTWARAGAWAAAIAAYLLVQGPRVGDREIVEMARRTVRRLAATAVAPGSR